MCNRYNAKINRENEEKKADDEFLKSEPTGGEDETACVKKQCNRWGTRFNVGPLMTTEEEKKGRNNSGGEEETDGFASDDVCEVGAHPLSPSPDKHRFAYDRHFAGSII